MEARKPQDVPTSPFTHGTICQENSLPDRQGHGNGQLPVRSAKLQLRLTVSWTPPEAAFDDLGAAETAN
jgi:hypothetical protein